MGKMQGCQREAQAQTKSLWSEKWSQKDGSHWEAERCKDTDTHQESSEEGGKGKVRLLMID
jgi:hypothetical protein